MTANAPISALADTADWQLYGQGRSRQRRAGLLAAAALVLAFVVLVDGLLSHMRGGGSYRLEMLPGTTEPVSGPMGSGRPVEEDVRAFPIPRDAPISFEFQGFFTSYWFGTGMWRGLVHVSETASSGTYGLAVGLEGQPSSTFQSYTISVAANSREQDRLSLSLVRRWTGFNPFILAALFGALGIGTAFGCYFLGRRLGNLLRDMGLAEVVRVAEADGRTHLFVVAGKRPVEGKSFQVLDENMHILGKAVYEGEKNGIADCFFVRGEPGGEPRNGSFVAFWGHELPPARPMRRGPFTPLLEKGMEAARRPNAADNACRPEESARQNGQVRSDGDDGSQGTGGGKMEKRA